MLRHAGGLSGGGRLGWSGRGRVRVRVKSEGHELDKSSNKSLLGIKFFALLYFCQPPTRSAFHPSSTTHHHPLAFPSCVSVENFFHTWTVWAQNLASFCFVWQTPRTMTADWVRGKEVRQQMDVASPRFVDSPLISWQTVQCKLLDNHIMSALFAYLSLSSIRALWPIEQTMWICHG